MDGIDGDILVLQVKQQQQQQQQQDQQQSRELCRD